eukprot:6854620-Pyramimonas_sp.AAC.1
MTVKARVSGVRVSRGAGGGAARAPVGVVVLPLLDGVELAGGRAERLARAVTRQELERAGEQLAVRERRLQQPGHVEAVGVGPLLAARLAPHQPHHHGAPPAAGGGTHQRRQRE